MGRGVGDGLAPPTFAAWCIHTRGNPRGRSPHRLHSGGPPPGVPSHRLSLRLSSRLPSSFLLSFPLSPFPHSLGRGGRPKGLSRTAAWRTGQPCSPRPDDPGPSPGTSTVGLAPARPLGPGRSDCPLGACRRPGTLEESGRRQAPPPPAMIALGPRRRGPGGCLAGPSCAAIWRAEQPRVPLRWDSQTGGSLPPPPEAPPLTPSPSTHCFAY